TLLDTLTSALPYEEKADSRKAATKLPQAAVTAIGILSEPECSADAVLGQFYRLLLALSLAASVHCSTAAANPEAIQLALRRFLAGSAATRCWEDVTWAELRRGANWQAAMSALLAGALRCRPQAAAELCAATLLGHCHRLTACLLAEQLLPADPAGSDNLLSRCSPASPTSPPGSGAPPSAPWRPLRRAAPRAHATSLLSACLNGIDDRDDAVCARCHGRPVRPAGAAWPSPTSAPSSSTSACAPAAPALSGRRPTCAERPSLCLPPSARLSSLPLAVLTEQAQSSLVPLLLHSSDPDPDAATEARRALSVLLPLLRAPGLSEALERHLRPGCWHPGEAAHAVSRQAQPERSVSAEHVCACLESLLKDPAAPLAPELEFAARWQATISSADAVHRSHLEAAGGEPRRDRLPVIRTAQRLGIETVSVYSDADRNALHVPPGQRGLPHRPRARQPELPGGRPPPHRRGQAVRRPGHPPRLRLPVREHRVCRALRSSGVTFIGPPANAIRDMGIKNTSKEIMERAGVPVIAGYHGNNQEPQFLLEQARKIGFPVMINGAAGSDPQNPVLIHSWVSDPQNSQKPLPLSILGRSARRRRQGMRIARSEAEFHTQLDSARREALKSFGNDDVLLEQCIEQPRHVEVQVFGDQYGNYLYFFERDCSVQRRHQKVIEEAPAPGISPETRVQLGEAACRAAAAVGYVGAGTVEFIMDAKEKFFFMEMNTRLQVEHPVSEMVTGVDLVELQIRVAEGQPLPMRPPERARIRGPASTLRTPGRLPAHRRPRQPPLRPGCRGWCRPRRQRRPLWRRHRRVLRPDDRQADRLGPRQAGRPAAPLRRPARLPDLRPAHQPGLPAGPGRPPEFAAGRVHTGFIEQHRDRLLASPPPGPRELALAALGLFLLRRQAARQATVGLADFRLNHAHREAVHFRLGDGPGSKDAHLVVEASPDGLLTVHGGGARPRHCGSAPASYRRTSGAGARLSSKRRRRRRRTAGAAFRFDLFLEADGSALSLFLGDRQHLLQVAPPKWRSAVSGAAAGSGSGVRAPMPGVIEKVLVSPGQAVKEGERWSR
uniref:Biotin carboxylation domain-containing protein n=1 Tax=Macrostomum lignano TaxID=282301 RepID=A0A1I8F734_9PLAT